MAISSPRFGPPVVCRSLDVRRQASWLPADPGISVQNSPNLWFTAPSELASRLASRPESNPLISLLSARPQPASADKQRWHAHEEPVEPTGAPLQGQLSYRSLPSEEGCGYNDPRASSSRRQVSACKRQQSGTYFLAERHRFGPRALSLPMLLACCALRHSCLAGVLRGDSSGHE